jgi:hypothetical protein
MSKAPEIYVFNAETLMQRDQNIATKVHQATVTSTVRKLNRMNPGQILNASRNNGRELYWSQAKLDKVLTAINDDDDE